MCVRVSGALAYSTQYSTGGNGGGVQSQGAIAVFGNYLFTVNPSSNTVVGFWINPINPAQLSMIGAPVSSQGTYPIAVCAKYAMLVLFTHCLAAPTTCALRTLAPPTRLR